ncbi:MAG: hypothetical protein HC849_33585 [Oscillatoriales cyanobacterium RU_3_3]|nr:hypothetical protein [Microcoleus sp. SM1_3_4]NJM63959.1 hypothetical protein [Oscillatoriales cyanobacterium RU_3_3]
MQSEKVWPDRTHGKFNTSELSIETRPINVSSLSHQYATTNTPRSIAIND